MLVNEPLVFIASLSVANSYILFDSYSFSYHTMTGFNDNDTQRLINLNTLFPVCGTVADSLGEVAFWKMYVIGGWALWYQMPTILQLIVCPFLICGLDLNSQLLPQCSAMTVTGSPSGTVSPNKLHLLLVILDRMYLPSN